MTEEYSQPARPVHVPVTIDGRTLFVEVTPVGDQEDQEVAARILGFAEFTDSLGALTGSLIDAVVGGMRKIKPAKVAVEFGCEVGLESSQLTAMLIKGSAKANLKVTLEWKPGEQS
ncbi:CU044_2847 family protein [Amycolatopsis sp. NPDC051061]|uniref:CU044_2847 family protein n=1 Tax=Amycolatopsis sp. NPDC051061 TaxID=3155042 RepID=UPI0034495446